MKVGWHRKRECETHQVSTHTHTQQARTCTSAPIFPPDFNILTFKISQISASSNKQNIWTFFSVMG